MTWGGKNVRKKKSNKKILLHVERKKIVCQSLIINDIYNDCFLCYIQNKCDLNYIHILSSHAEFEKIRMQRVKDT